MKGLVAVAATIFLVTGCGLQFVPVKSGSVVVDIETDSDTPSQLNITVANNSNRKVYTPDFQCLMPFTLYQNGKQISGLYPDGFCFAPGPPELIKPGQIVTTKRHLREPGDHYQIQLTYYPNQDLNKEEGKTTLSNEFTVIPKTAEVQKNNLESIVQSCDPGGDSYQKVSQEVNCLYIEAKTIAVDRLDLALQLCQTIEDLGHGFDGCYDGVALMLQDKGLTEQALTVCNRYATPERIQSCLKIAQRK